LQRYTISYRQEKGGKISEQIFGINDRLLATLFNGTPASENLTFPLATRLGTGGYVTRVLS
jgi:hypothetical protein